MKIRINNITELNNFETANILLTTMHSNTRLEILESEYTVDITIQKNETCQEAIKRHVNSKVEDGVYNSNVRKRIFKYFGIYN